MVKRYDVIVVGVGTMGAATCWALAQRGVRVLGLEQGAIPNASGSAGGFSRMIRLGYYEHADYVPLLKRAHQLWGELEQASGITLFRRTGGLYMGQARRDFIRRSREAAEAHDLPHAMLDRAELAERYPMFTVPDDFAAYYEPLAGMLLAERAISAAAEQALRHGAELQGHEPVEAWQAEPGGVRVRTTAGTYQADRLVLAGGPWSGRLLADLGVKLKVTRQVMGWTWPGEPDRFALDALPCWAVENPDGSLHYGFPMTAENVGLKVAHHYHGPPTDPDRVDREAKPADVDDFLPALRRYVPAAVGPVLAIRVCMYTCTADSHFLIDRHPQHEQVSFAAGFSGHGFKFMPVIGQIMADLATTGRCDLPIEFLDLRRLRK